MTTRAEKELPPEPGTGESPWGPDDQLGAANELDELTLLAGLALVKRGVLFDLSQPLSRESPRLPVVQSPYSMCLWSNPSTSAVYFTREEGATNGVAFADERVELDLHTGTHIDALGHTWINGRGYNGVSVADAVGNWGLLRCGIEHVPPIVTRGLLLDVAALRGRELDPGELVTADDLTACCRREGVTPGRGDIVFVRTGWARYYGVANDVYTGNAPGIGLGAARWLTGQHVVAVGSDTMGLEVWPGERPEWIYPVHQYLLAASGTYIIEQANLEVVAAEGIWEFASLCLAPAFKGATGSPIRLTAAV